MTMTRSALFAIALLCLPGAAGHAQDRPKGAGNVVFTGGAQPMFRLTDAKATVLDDQGKPLFVADEAFIKRYAGNSTGRVLEWNPDARRIRISASKPAWLDCNEVEEMALACSDLRIAVDAKGGVSVTRAGKGPDRGGGGVRPVSGVAGRVPSCPGDPRCPRM